MISFRLPTINKAIFWEYRGLILAWIAVGLAFAGLLAVIFMDFPSDKKVRIACDKYVAVLMTSDSLVEITRAGILVDRLSCGMRRRL